MKTKLLLVVFTLCALTTLAQPTKPNTPMNYGEPINLETAKKIAAAAEAFALKNQWIIS